jgi:hypothetical protein
MSLNLVEEEIHTFLATDRPEVICISGQWGVGKTFPWNKYLKEAHKQGNIKLSRYSYVSLFGVNSLQDFKYSIFENSVLLSNKDLEPNLKTFRTNTSAVLEQMGRKSYKFIEQIPWFKSYVGGLGSAWFLSVSETLVCVDDIDRAGKGLPIREIFGLSSYLKEHKKCKVVFLLNEGALDPTDGDFSKYFEKVVDISLRFEPSAQESVSVALQGDGKETHILRESCITLGISNIRLIKRIERSIQQVKPMLDNFDQELIKSAVESLTLLGWSIFEPDRAPSLDYLKKRNTVADYSAKSASKVIPTREAAWNSLLNAYKFRSMDKFDYVLMEGIKNGYFDSTALRNEAEVIDKQIKNDRQNRSFMLAWEKYHDSFENNDNEVLDQMYESFKENLANISPSNLNSTVTIFKHLGRTEQATEMIALYLENRGQKRELFDVNSISMFGNLTDPDVAAAFKRKYESLHQVRELKEILLSVQNSWNPEDIESLSSFSVEDYYTVIKSSKGEELRSILKACFQFERFGNSTEPMKEISNRAREAVRIIAKESPLNAVRARQFGVDLNSQP